SSRFGGRCPPFLVRSGGFVPRSSRGDARCPRSGDEYRPGRGDPRPGPRHRLVLHPGPGLRRARGRGRRGGEARVRRYGPGRDRRARPHRDRRPPRGCRRHRHVLLRAQPGRPRRRRPAGNARARLARHTLRDGGRLVEAPPRRGRGARQDGCVSPHELLARQARLARRDRAGDLPRCEPLRIVYETEQPQPKPGLFLYLLDDGRVVEGGSLSDGGNLYGWIRDTLKNTEGSLADRDPDSHGLTFLTLLGGERSTGWNPFAKGAIAGLTFDTTPLDIRQ